MNFKKITGIFIVIASLLVVFNSCSTDVDLYADYKDITIVYGLLDAGQDTNFIKITKAFLGPGNALEIAKDPDSSNYAQKLNVILQGKKNGADQNPIVLDTITIHNKLAGDSIFYFPSQLLYYTTATLDPNAQYTLKIEPESKAIEAKTDMIASFGVVRPVNFINFASTSATQIEWNSAHGGKRYEVQIIFNYKELRPGNPDTLYKQMFWNLGTRHSQGLDGGEEMSVSYMGSEFYSRLGQELDDELNVKRWAGEVLLTISAGGEELSTFIDVNAPSNSIVQEIPQYTNILNGYGIFSARSKAVKVYNLNPLSETKLVEDYNWGFRIAQ
ncbi:MAG: DUF4249 family protein [Bacteroidales bacterium]|jgi:hypothetical protein|nr:DUF4249 family protein [Bacteroidales bacterium]HOI32470.1 DUF4249 family protein [Bacteroidales bacterium]